MGEDIGEDPASAVLAKAPLLIVISGEIRDGSSLRNSFFARSPRDLKGPNDESTRLS
jgi:hypothetical protein